MRVIEVACRVPMSSTMLVAFALARGPAGAEHEPVACSGTDQASRAYCERWRRLQASKSRAARALPTATTRCARTRRAAAGREFHCPDDATGMAAFARLNHAFAERDVVLGATSVVSCCRWWLAHPNGRCRALRISCTCRASLEARNLAQLQKANARKCAEQADALTARLAGWLASTRIGADAPCLRRDQRSRLRQLLPAARRFDHSYPGTQFAHADAMKQFFFGSRATAVATTLLIMLTASACSSPPALHTPAASATSFQPVVGQAGKDAIWVPTPDAIVERMLDFAKVGPGDRLVDLGSGDGKISIAAARRGADSRGIEFDPEMVALSRRNAAAAGVKASFAQGDIFESDFSDADVVMMYLLPELNLRLRPILLKMKPGTRIASHNYNMGDWAPDDYSTLGGGYALHWRVPADVSGRWQVRIESEAAPLRIELTQRFQFIEGQADWGATSSPLQHLWLSGADISFVAADANGALHRFTGSVGQDGRMQGQAVASEGAARSFDATRLTKSGE